MQIVTQIRKSIADGTLKIGDKLPPERVLAQQFGTSRASIREALSALELLGLVESKSGQGNIIKVDATGVSLDSELLKQLLKDHEPYEIFESRLELEPSLAALAAARASAEERRELATQVERLRELGARCERDPALAESYMEEDRKLHMMIGTCAHNSVLFMVFSGVNLMMKEAHWRALKLKGIQTPGSLARYAEEHGSIVAAICEGKAEEARDAMRRHLLIVRAELFDE